MLLQVIRFAYLASVLNQLHMCNRQRPESETERNVWCAQIHFASQQQQQPHGHGLVYFALHFAAKNNILNGKFMRARETMFVRKRSRGVLKGTNVYVSLALYRCARVVP